MGPSSLLKKAEQSKGGGGAPSMASKLGSRISSIGRFPWMGSCCQGVPVRQDIDIDIDINTDPLLSPANALQMATRGSTAPGKPRLREPWRGRRKSKRAATDKDEARQTGKPQRQTWSFCMRHSVERGPRVWQRAKQGGIRTVCSAVFVPPWPCCRA